MGGWFRDTKVTLMAFDYRHLEYGHATLMGGKLGKYTMNDTSVQFELANWASLSGDALMIVYEKSKRLRSCPVR